MLDSELMVCWFSESLRKYPPATGLIRCATADYEIPDTKVVIEKGTTVLVPVYAIHHDPEFYPEPEMYDPERFTTENEAKRNPFSFLPFGEGPRNCIGLRFGLMQARIGLATLLSSFRFEIASPTAMPLVLSKTSAVLTPVGGVWLKVEKLNENGSLSINH
jgi:cytochrome P450 family 6